ncbi:MAG: tRNA (adenosine(37)-N6)-threonylcarbamoyltransferase complex ATPase subunit type 1 TsaE [Planctomycetes bacterium]|jgi:tRNA threonylcarbamoyladenosine biosynthesis protein TsaE|nr:tRNA (adenosine(37)-N6)-threonylcarbamoyltransferase complex ATPase subunit type 1 TsaE [Planctomycetota bacterium]MDP6423658.1 tRNA (adenosine(37)-N6)-threonylcarbamoyltransferase complex ATPase subunit type 1 TsaE [Planctomycetota bacterium]
MTSPEVLWRTTTASAADTERLGAEVGRLLGPGDGVALKGELGAGKTVFVRGLGRGLGIDDPEDIRSPTYLLMIEHPGPTPLLHMDAYFAERSQDLLADGGEAYLVEGGVLAVEWADRLRMTLPEAFLQVELAHLPEGGRTVRFRGDPGIWGPKVTKLLRQS